MYGPKGALIVDVAFNSSKTSFLIWIDSNCPSWNWISFDNILAGRILQLWYTWDFESLILMFSDM